MANQSYNIISEGQAGSCDQWVMPLVLLLYIELTISSDWRKRAVNFGNQCLLHIILIIMPRRLEVTCNQIMYDWGVKFASFVWLFIGEDAKQHPDLQLNVYCCNIFSFNVK